MNRTAEKIAHFRKTALGYVSSSLPGEGFERGK